MADIVQRVVLDTKDALGALGEMRSRFDGLAKAAGGIAEKIVQGVTRIGTLGAVGGAGLGVLKGVAGAALGLSDITASRTLAAAQAGLQQQFTLQLPIVGGPSVTTTAEQALALTAPEKLAQFRAQQGAFGNVSDLVGRLGESGVPVSDAITEQLFAEEQARKQRGLEAQLRAARLLDPQLAKAVLGLESELSSIRQQNLKLSAADQVIQR